MPAVQRAAAERNAWLTRTMTVNMPAPVDQRVVIERPPRPPAREPAVRPHAQRAERHEPAAARTSASSETRGTSTTTQRASVSTHQDRAVRERVVVPADVDDHEERADPAVQHEDEARPHRKRARSGPANLLAQGFRQLGLLMRD
jgi:hypothetical protein